MDAELLETMRALSLAVRCLAETIEETILELEDEAPETRHGALRIIYSRIALPFCSLGVSMNRMAQLRKDNMQ
jgi:hypothetical protein